MQFQYFGLGVAEYRKEFYVKQPVRSAVSYFTTQSKRFFFTSFLTDVYVMELCI